MHRVSGGLILAGSLVLSVSWAWAQERTWIAIDYAGKERGGFVPTSQPYSAEGPSVAVYLFNHQDLRTADGQALTGFEFIGWAEGDGTRVHVFALIPKDGAPNIYMPGGDPNNVRRRDFASYLLNSGQSQPIAEMAALRLEPMVLRAALRKAKQK